MPLPRLQIVGGQADPFLYTIAWDQSIQRSEVRGYEKGEASFDNRILLRPHVGEYLVRLNGLLRPLIHRGWAAMVAQLNRLEEARLERFLFGAERVPTQARGWSASCSAPSASLPRPCGRANNAIENLVVSHERCNGYKRDFLAAAGHVAAWRCRLEPGSAIAVQLVQLAEDKAWERGQDRSLSVARAIYLHLPDGYKLWVRGRHFDDLDRGAVTEALV
jgi:hypothetical protein